VHRQTGEVHAIKHLQVPRTVSALEGPKGTRAAQAVWRLFGNEMHLLQSLSESEPPVPGIAVMLQAYRADENSPAYAMPLMRETLGARIERGGPLPEPEAVGTLVSLARTVGMLHERGIVHRGLSPRSVMLDRSGSVCLGGFDDAGRLEERSQLLLAEHELQQATRSALYVLGDVRFLSPERCRGEEFDERTDIYSLGALLFYLLAGVAPFEGADEMQVMLDHVSGSPPRLREVGAEASARVQQVIDRALAKSSDARFASVAAMVEALTGPASRAHPDAEPTP
jgi:serine/threonine protein kinase